jgi:hypothetical protein
MPEVPIDITLAFVEGKMTTGNRMMFSTTDDRVLFLSAAAGQEVQAKLRDLRIQAGDRVLLRLTRDYSTGQCEETWEVYRAGAVPVGKQANGSIIVPKQPGAEPPAPEAAPVTGPKGIPNNPSTAAPHSSSPFEHSGPALHLRERTQMLVDVYASCLTYAEQRYPRVSAEDVRELLLAEIARQS